MKKRQKPYVLIAVLVVCMVLVAFMNTPPAKNNGQHAPDPAESPKTGNEVDVPKKSDVAASVGEKLKGKKRPKQGEDPDEMGAPKIEGPVVVKKKVAPYVPKPNDSSTAGQWYEQDAAKSYSGDKKAAKGDN